MTIIHSAATSSIPFDLAEVLSRIELHPPLCFDLFNDDGGDEGVEAHKPL